MEFSIKMYVLFFFLHYKIKPVLVQKQPTETKTRMSWHASNLPSRSGKTNLDIDIEKSRILYGNGCSVITTCHQVDSICWQLYRDEIKACRTATSVAREIHTFRYKRDYKLCCVSIKNKCPLRRSKYIHTYFLQQLVNSL